MRLNEFFSSQIWEFAFIAMGRMRKDARSRKYLAQLFGTALLLAAVPIVLAVLLGMVIIAPASLSFLGMVVGLGVGFGIRYARQEARRDNALRQAAEAVPEHVRRSLFQSAFWLASLLRRCESENYLLKEIPPNIQIITRRVLLDKLKARGVWDEIPSGARDLLLKPDGHWTEGERAKVTGLFELLICLRWITRKDEQIRWLALPPKYNFKQAREIADDQQWLSELLTVAPAQIEVQAKSAAGAMNRAIVEAIGRGMVQVGPEQLAAALSDLKSVDPRTDWLFRGRSIGELSTDDLRFVHRRAVLRWQMLRSAGADMSSGGAEAQVSRLWDSIFPTEPGGTN